MATLDIEVQNRYPAQLLVNLTNAFGGGTTLNTTRLLQAATDTVRYMRIYAQVNFDPTNADHQALGSDALFYLLQIQSGAVDFEQFFNRFIPMLERLAKISTRDIVAPTTDSPLIGSTPVQAQRPWSDPSRLRGGTLDAPGTGNPFLSDRTQNS